MEREKINQEIIDEFINKLPTEVVEIAYQAIKTKEKMELEVNDNRKLVYQNELEEIEDALYKVFAKYIRS